MNIDDKLLGKAIARFRELRGLTQAQLNERTGMSTIQHIEQGRNTVSMTALKDKLVYSRISGSIRIAGFADFLGFDTGADADRGELLLQSARQLAPRAADYDADDATVWGGFRPMTPDGRPQVGPTPVDGLYLNTGHGMLGWTLACATGYDAAHAVARVH